jgi:hypothetical protein
VLARAVDLFQVRLQFGLANLSASSCSISL